MAKRKENPEAKKRSRYEIVIVRSALKQLDKISDPYYTKISNEIDLLEFNPRPFGVEKLTNRDNEYRIRVGVYRIIYSIFDRQLLVEVIDIDHRKQVYR